MISGTTGFILVVIFLATIVRSSLGFGEALILRVVDDGIVKLLLGATIIGVSAYSLVRGAAASIRSDDRGSLVAAGIVSGVLGGAYGMNGPPLAIYGALRGWSPHQFRATLQGYFLVASIAGLVGYGVAGLWSAAATHYLLLSLPCVLGAIVVARRLNRFAEHPRFFRAVYGSLIVIGLILIVQAAVPGASAALRGE
ncbi:MAG TPA: TSUP family transporter [Gemmatimonadaceae bacterium]|nr:TSUP family transporter [Gemmatimonadaceae bacterium]